jgi:6-phosphogluconate dehydrogenase
MQIGMIGIGRMGGDMVRRLLRKAHKCLFFDIKSEAMKTPERQGVRGARSIEDFVAGRVRPRIVWLMVRNGIEYGFGGHREKAAVKTGGA